MNKYLKAVIIGIGCTALCMVLSLLTHPEITTYVQSENAVSVLSSATYSPAHAKFDAATFHFMPTQGDAQLLIKDVDAVMNAVYVETVDPLPENTRCQLYYSLDGAGLSEGASVVVLLSQATNRIAFRLPELAEYDYFRLDIDRDYFLYDIAVDAAEPEAVSYISCIARGLVSFPFVQFIMCLVILLAESILFAWKWDAIIAWVRIQKNAYKNNQPAFLRVIIHFLCSVFVSILLWLMVQLINPSASWSLYSLFYFIAAGIAVGSLIVFYQHMGEHPERVFIILGLCVGMLFVILEPPSMLLSWDDEIHYKHALFISYGNEPYYTSAETAMIERRVSNTVNLENMRTLTSLLNEGHLDGAEAYRRDSVSITSLSYMPMAAGLWLGRVLCLPFTGILILGKIGNLLCYLLTVYFAMKQLKQGKMLVAILALIPTVVFMAGNYSYDPFCIGFILLGFCIWLGVYQDKTAQMTGKKTFAMLLSLALGISTKMIYFPMLLIPLFLPSKKFETQKKRRLYILSILIVIICMIVYLAAPFIIKTNKAYTDTRGGSNVNGSEQLHYIISHPLNYINTLMNFMFNTYLNVDAIMHSINGCVRSLAYLSIGGIVFSNSLAYIYVILAIVVFFGTTWNNQNNIEQPSTLTKSVAAIISFATLCATATALYISFTPVGSSGISGCQERYMLPIVSALLLIVRPSFHINTIPEKKFNEFIFCAYTIIMFLGLLPLMYRYL